ILRYIHELESLAQGVVQLVVPGVEDIRGVVHGLRPRIRGEEEEALAEALLGLYLERVVMRCAVAVTLIDGRNIRRDGVERQPRSDRSRAWQALVQLQVAIEMQAMGSDVGRGDSDIARQLMLDAEIPYLRFILTEVIGHKEHAESGRRSERAARSVGNDKRSSEPRS